MAGDTLCHSCMQHQMEERCIQCDNPNSSWGWRENRGLCSTCRGRSLASPPQSLADNDDVEGEDDHAGVVLAGDEPEPEPAPKVVLKMVELIDPITLKRFRAEVTSDNCYTGRWSWITEEF